MIESRIHHRFQSSIIVLGTLNECHVSRPRRLRVRNLFNRTRRPDRTYVSGSILRMIL